MVTAIVMILTALLLQTPDTKKSVWQGAYTAAQAERGQKAYEANCAGCHQADLRGKGEIPALKGDGFMERWHDYSVKPLFNMIRTEMPPLRFRTPDTRPLPDPMYVDIIAYLFKVNSFPEGSEELTVENLDRVQILAKNGAQPPPQFALVLSVGCMRFTRNSWTLSYATSPVRATMPDAPLPDEIQAAKNVPLGLREYRLADFGYLGRGFNPEILEDHRVLVKGYIIRQPEFERISVTSVTDIASNCE